VEEYQTEVYITAVPVAPTPVVEEVASSKLWTLYTAESLAKEFKTLALRTKTDKVTLHHYEWLYSKYVSGTQFKTSSCLAS